MPITLDVTIFRAINDLANQIPWLDACGYFAAHYLIYVMVVLLGLQVWAKSWRKEVQSAAPFTVKLRRVFWGPFKPDDEIGLLTLTRAIMAAGCAWLINQTFYLFFFRARPFVALSDVNLLLDMNPMEKSFPSDHATASFAIAFAVALSRPGLGALLLFFAAIVAWGRIFVGVHYPSDILAGFALGLIWALAARQLMTSRRFSALLKRVKRLI